MTYAEVAVGVRTEPGKSFSYSIPPDLHVQVGHAVQVPFGPRQLPGFVFELTDLPGFPETRDIARVVDSQPWLSEAQVELAKWLSESYHASLYSAASLMIPPGFRQKVVAVYVPAQEPPSTALQSLDERQDQVYQYVRKRGRANQGEVETRFGKRPAGIVLGQLVRKRLLVRAWEWRKPTVQPKFAGYAALAVDRREALAEAERLSGSRAVKQGAVLRAIAEAEPKGMLVSELAAAFGRPALKALEKRGPITIHRERVERDPLAYRQFPVTSAPELTSHQRRAWSKISQALDGPQDERPSVFLLHGVTGSGKTELYLRALEKVVSQGKRGIVLVPEISLTPQTIARFSGRFPDRVAVLHSRLSPGQYFDEWWRIREGDFDVVIGSRGAVFSPQPNLGLIVLDEEHEWTYKQQEQQPRYHAREVAVKLGALTGATVILGSATPQLESYHKATTGEYRLLELPERISAQDDGQAGTGQLPKVELVDMREELKSGNRSVFSRALSEGVTAALERKEQVILFLNRRGAATFVQCRDCGYVARCRRCATTLTYHGESGEGGQLRCHQCGYRTAPPLHCPECWGPRIRYMGLGTERLEMEAAKAFPNATTVRWDRDVTQASDSHERILRQVLSHEADILIGTQMIAKGLHLPKVSLVGVVNGDIGLHAPDFRAGERVFQVLCQVAGRSGRGADRGRVIVQTYSPANYAIAAAAIQDYKAFYDQEVRLRMESGLPPFSRLARLVYHHTNAVVAQREAEHMHRALKEQLQAWAFPGTKLVGPAPAPHERIRGRYRWHIIIQAPDPILLLQKVPIPEGWTADVDPVQLL